MKKISSLLLAVFLVPFISFSQLGGLKDRMKKKAEPLSAPSKNDNTSKSDSPLSMPKTSTAAIDFNQHPFPPSILLSSLLENGFGLHSDQKTPFFFLPVAVFLPTKDVKGNNIEYEREKYIAGVIKQQDKIIYREYLIPIGNSVPLVTLKSSETFREPEAPAEGMESGNYTCEIMLDGKTIFSMPFEMIVVKNDDPYAKGRDKEFRLMDGYWSKYGYYDYNDDGLFVWNIFQCNLDKTFGKQNKELKMETQLFYNGKPLSKVLTQAPSVERGVWKKNSSTLVNINSPKTSTSYIKKEDMKDGAYTLKVKINGEESNYLFNIKDGKHIMIDEQDKTKNTDRAKVFEGTNKEFWVKRSN
jgi:hypothetical protein